MLNYDPEHTFNPRVLGYLKLLIEKSNNYMLTQPIVENTIIVNCSVNSQDLHSKTDKLLNELAEIEREVCTFRCIQKKGSDKYRE